VDNSNARKGAAVNIKLYDYFRSSACYRVRIALNLKGLPYKAIDTSLVDGAHKMPEYLSINPQGFVPMLDADGLRLTQSVAIIEWLDSVMPVPRFVPAEPNERARQMALAMTIACDIHPLNNLRVLKYLGREFGVEEAKRDIWYRNWVLEGFDALEAMAGSTPFLGGNAPGIADICLVPQMFNARRFATPLESYPNLVRVDANCTALDAFARAHPDVVKSGQA
jgi:maleylacetoacetate isomerase